jgi:hypothetical protein
MALASWMPNECEYIELVAICNGSLVYKPGRVVDTHRDGRSVVIVLEGHCRHEGRIMWTAEAGELRPHRVTAVANPMRGESVDILLEDGCWHPAAFAGFDPAGIAWVLRSGKQ